MRVPVLDQIVRRIPRPLRHRVRARIEPKMLREGEAAPEWNLLGHDGSWHSPGEHWSLLVFYPGDATPGCTRQLREIEEHLPRMTDLGCRVYGLNPASAESHAAFASELGLTFPLLVDTEGRVARQYGALLELPVLGSRVLRTVYLINPSRKIRLANRGSPSIAAILRSIDALQKVTRAGM